MNATNFFINSKRHCLTTVRPSDLIFLHNLFHIAPIPLEALQLWFVKIVRVRGQSYLSSSSPRLRLSDFDFSFDLITHYYVASFLASYHIVNSCVKAKIRRIIDYF